jgi:hypothetical protein
MSTEPTCFQLTRSHQGNIIFSEIHSTNAHFLIMSQNGKSQNSRTVVSIVCTISFWKKVIQISTLFWQ